MVLTMAVSMMLALRPASSKKQTTEVAQITARIPLGVLHSLRLCTSQAVELLATFSVAPTSPNTWTAEIIPTIQVRLFIAWLVQRKLSRDFLPPFIARDCGTLRSQVLQSLIALSIIWKALDDNKKVGFMAISISLDLYIATLS